MLNGMKVVLVLMLNGMKVVLMLNGRKVVLMLNWHEGGVDDDLV